MAAMQLDHVVVNVRREMDRAEALLQSIGFEMTPRGFHSLGSINHLMVFACDYLELLGLPADGSGERPEIANAPVGLNGLVFKTNDVDETYEHLRTVGLAGEPPKSFSRPVILPDGEHLARFRTVTARSDRFPGRVYFCEHGTPELVWRPQWSRHPNATVAIGEVVVVATDYDREAELYADATRSEVIECGAGRATIAHATSVLTVITPERYRKRYGALSAGIGEAPFFGAVVLRSGDLTRTAASLEAGGEDIRIAQRAAGLTVRLEQVDTLLEWVGLAI